jgi:hypothetical protein
MKFTNTITRFSPLTVRGYLLMALALFLVLGPLRVQNDIVAGTIGFSLFGIVILSLCIITLSARLIRNGLSLDLGLPTSDLYSKQELSLLLKIESIRIPPLFYLNLELKFDKPGVAAHQIRISGSQKQGRTIAVPTIFPHRGRWSVKEIAITLSDQFGLSSRSWTINQSSEITIAPAPVSESDLPPRSSADRPGELAESHMNRQGDPFDIKQYHPADGMKRILWKIFARSGELLSRHPEPSVTPDGQVVVYVLADSREDAVASAALSYVESLEMAGVEIFFGCLGMALRGAATTRSEAQELLIESVWDATTATPVEEALSLIRTYNDRYLGSAAARIILLLGKTRAADPAAATNCLTLGDTLAAQGVQPIFALVGDQFTVGSTTIIDYFFESDTKTLIDEPNISGLLRSCMGRSWEVLVSGEGEKL